MKKEQWAGESQQKESVWGRLSEKPKFRGIQTAKTHYQPKGHSILPPAASYWGLLRTLRTKNRKREPSGSSFAHLVGCFCKGLFSAWVPAAPPSNWIISYFWPVLIGFPLWRWVVFLWTTHIRFIWALKVVVLGPTQAEPLGICIFTTLLSWLGNMWMIENHP